MLSWRDASFLCVGFVCFAACKGVAGPVPFRVVGSTAVYPFAAAVAERLASQEKSFWPVVEANGTGAGFWAFCRDRASSPIAVVMASRRMNNAEINACQEGSMHSRASLPHEFIVGNDGITLVVSKAIKPFALTRDQLFRALAKWHPHDGTLVKNTLQTWYDIDNRLPKAPIKIFGPTAQSGTRDALITLAIRESCRKAHKNGLLREQDIRKCSRMRDDGAYVEVGASDHVIIHKVLAHPGSLGIMSYCFYDRNRANIQALALDDVHPTPSTIASHKYPLARPLYLYVHPDLDAQSDHAVAFLMAFWNRGRFRLGSPDWLTKKGLVTLNTQEINEQITQINHVFKSHSGALNQHHQQSAGRS